MSITGTYGLGTSVRGPSGGRGIAGDGVALQRDAMGSLGEVAQQEADRNSFNSQARAAKRQSAASGIASGASSGFMVGGPWGALAGAAFGGLMSASF